MLDGVPADHGIGPAARQRGGRTIEIGAKQARGRRPLTIRSPPCRVKARCRARQRAQRFRHDLEKGALSATDFDDARLVEIGVRLGDSAGA